MADMKNIAPAATLRPNPARQLRAELAGKIALLIGNEENRITEIPGGTLPAPPVIALLISLPTLGLWN